MYLTNHNKNLHVLVILVLELYRTIQQTLFLHSKSCPYRLMKIFTNDSISILLLSSVRKIFILEVIFTHGTTTKVELMGE